MPPLETTSALLPWLYQPFLGQAVWAWLLFMGIVLTLLVLDLGVLNRGDKEISIRASLWQSAGYIAAGVAFGGWIAVQQGSDAGLTYLTGYVIEKALSIDNLFVIATVFAALQVPRHLQHRVLFWGILGVIVLRALLIGGGTALVQRFDWMLPVFGALLVWTGWRMWPRSGMEDEPPSIPGLETLRRWLRVTPQLQGNQFWVRRDVGDGKGKQWWVTPLFLALCAIETADLIFAIDSVPAVLAVTTDPYLVYTSNIFAILGLRALYFALAEMLHRFHYLKHALAVLLVMIGAKVLFAPFLGHPPSWVSLTLTISILAAGVGLSLARPDPLILRRTGPAALPAPGTGQES
ncbi:TerC family protein [Inhella gelatinilytica]|uniref:TerC family protein n=1 Tax=Inhella gelatinilytica TaxID=2795030 RepID=A0A931IV09_9BURK|nr:TerC family protein [Inhella gelatinilytica]MBH9551504.1 TerC family protein [Inhella gelatinilytica]